MYSDVQAAAEMMCNMLTRKLGGAWDFMDIREGSYRAEFRVYDEWGGNVSPDDVMDIIGMNIYVSDVVHFGNGSDSEFAVTINAPYI